MASITTGVGLISGLDYQSIVDQLMAIEARPRNLVLTRISGIDAQRTAYLDISARITALLTRINVLVRPSAFTAAKATSSLPDILTATASAGAQPGSYSVLVRALAATQQSVSRGFHDRTAPLSAGTLTIESAAARVNRSTHLGDLNGHMGVRRGSVKIINSAGQEALVNLDDALTVAEVLDKINANTVSVRASIRGDALVLTDTAGGSGAVRVREVSGGATAADIGFGTGHNTGADGELVGRELVYLSSSSPLTAFNDGLGLRHSEAGGDFEVDVRGTTFSVDLSDILKHSTRLERLNHGQAVRLGTVRITSRDKSFVDVDLTGAKTITDVKAALEGAFGGSRISVVLAGSRLLISDQTDVTELEADQTGDFIIEDLSGHAAQDLGINGREADGSLSGRDILYMDTVQDALNAVTYAAGNEGVDKLPMLEAALGTGGRGLVLRTRSGSFTLRVPDKGSHALTDLGLAEGTYYDTGGGAEAAGKRVLAGLDSVLLRTLNGGQGFTGTTLQISANGQSATLNLAGAETLADVIDQINGAVDASGQSLGVEAAYDSTGTRIVVSNAVAGTDITLSGDFATALGLAQTGAALKSDNLQRQYISEMTALEELNAGRGISRGRFAITARNGASGTVDLTSSSIATLQDVIDQIGRLQIGVTARINDTGDGLLLTDTTTGTGTLKVEESGGQTAHDLNLLGTSTTAQIDGAFEFRLDVGGNDTLELLASRITAETTLARAGVLNDGTGTTPFRLSMAALVSGAKGELIIDDGGGDLGITTLTRAQDARVLFGAGAGGGLLLTSSSNTFDETVDGLSFTVSGVDDHPATITVERDTASLVDALKGLVTDFNSALARVKEAGAYDADKEKLGILQGEGTQRTIESRLRRMFSTTVVGGGTYTHPSQLGLKVENGQLTFNEEKFRAAFEANPSAVQAFFTDTEHGVAVTVQNQIEALTDTDGLIGQRTKSLAGQKTLFQDRVDRLNDQLDRKRARLLKQFQAMEVALSQMQAQQQTLANFSLLTSSSSKSSSSS